MKIIFRAIPHDPMEIKLIFRAIIFSLLVCGTSHAQVWNPIASSKDADYFLDRGSVRLVGGFISYSQLSNYPDGYRYGDNLIYSMVQSRLSDCIQNKFKTVGFVGYANFDGKGDILVVSTSRDRDWVSINMNKITGEIQREVCKLKN